MRRVKLFCVRGLKSAEIRDADVYFDLDGQVGVSVGELHLQPQVDR